MAAEDGEEVPGLSEPVLAPGVTAFSSKCHRSHTTLTSATTLGPYYVNFCQGSLPSLDQCVLLIFLRK